MKTSIVTTTINIPKFLENYIPNIEKYGHKNVNIIIVGDSKTPKETKDYILENHPYLWVEYWDVKDQEKWIDENYPNQKEDIAFAIPYQSVRRRNFGYLRALELGSDAIITIDDDNLTTEEDWLKGHLDTFSKPMKTVFSPNRFVNACEMLNSNHNPLYMRGYPMSEIFSDEFVSSTEMNKRPVVMNMGLWNFKPDVDSYSNIIYPDLDSNGIKAGFDDNYALEPNHYIQINTQNTSFLRKVMPAYYLLFQDTRIYENRIDRFDDIWSGLILQKIANTLGETVSFGKPFANHMRNTHDYAKDLKCEFSGLALNDKISKFIVNSNLDCTDYKDGYEKMRILIDKYTTNRFHPEVEMFFKRMTKAMGIWNKLTNKWM